MPVAAVSLFCATGAQVRATPGLVRCVCASVDTHGMAGCSCNHSKDPNATISWTSVTAVDAPRCALVPTIEALCRIEAGEFVMLDYGIRYDMDNN